MPAVDIALKLRIANDARTFAACGRLSHRSNAPKGNGIGATGS